MTPVAASPPLPFGPSPPALGTVAGGGPPSTAALPSGFLADVPLRAASSPGATTPAGGASTRLSRSAGLRPGAAVPSQIVRTVKRAVAVVPPVIWVLVAVLALASSLLAGGSALLAHRKRRVERQREALLEDVGLLQRALLPPAPEQIAGVATSVAYRPASGRNAGGDFYDVFALDGERLGLLIGDVSATGHRALGLTTLVRHTLRAYLEVGMAPRAALAVGSGVLAHHLGGDPASVTAAVYDRETGMLTYAGAGHPPPVVLGSVGFEPVTACPSPPLGEAEPTGLRQTSVLLPAGSLACFYTDGVVEARVGGELFGYRRLWLALSRLAGRATAPAVLERVAEEADALPDDMAVCVLRVAHHVPAAGAGQGVGRIEELELSRDSVRTIRPSEFLTACGVPSDRVDALIEEARAAVQRLGGGVLRVEIGPGVARAELALSRMDALAPALTAPRPRA